MVFGRRKYLKRKLETEKKSVSFDYMKNRNFYKSKNFCGLSLLFSTLFVSSETDLY